MNIFNPNDGNLTLILYTPVSDILEIKIDKYPELSEESLYTPEMPKSTIDVEPHKINVNFPETYEAPKIIDNVETTPTNIKVNGSIKDRAKSLMNRLQTELKINKLQAAGVVGNIMVESKFDPNAKGDGGKAIGLAQWHPERRNGVDLSTYEKLVDHLIKELKEEATWNARGGLNALRQAKTAEEAASIIDKNFERSSGQHESLRRSYAKYFSSLRKGGKI